VKQVLVYALKTSRILHTRSHSACNYILTFKFPSKPKTISAKKLWKSLKRPWKRGWSQLAHHVKVHEPLIQQYLITALL